MFLSDTFYWGRTRKLKAWIARILWYPRGRWSTDFGEYGNFCVWRWTGPMFWKVWIRKRKLGF